jgi:hypothetical protein
MCCDQEFAENWLNILGGFKAPLGFCLLLQISCWQASIICGAVKEKKSSNKICEACCSQGILHSCD